MIYHMTRRRPVRGRRVTARRVAGARGRRPRRGPVHADAAWPGSRCLHAGHHL